MAKKQRNQRLTVAFNYLVKSFPNPHNVDNPIEEGFTEREFDRVLDRISDLRAVDDTDEEVVARIKGGEELPFLMYREVDAGLYFGKFEGAYYGQRYRNNVLGEVDPESLNMRQFYYLICRLRDGRIVVGTTYHGLFGDYDGLRSVLRYHLSGDYKITSKTLRSISTEIGDGVPVSLELTYRKARERAEHAKPLFGTTGVIAIKNTDFGADFEETVSAAAERVRGSENQRRRVLAELVRQGELIELNDDDIKSCKAIVRKQGRVETVYLLGENSHSTRFMLNVEIGAGGMTDPNRVQDEMIRVMREKIIPLIQ